MEYLAILFKFLWRNAFLVIGHRVALRTVHICGANVDGDGSGDVSDLLSITRSIIVYSEFIYPRGQELTV